MKTHTSLYLKNLENYSLNNCIGLVDWDEIFATLPKIFKLAENLFLKNLAYTSTPEKKGSHQQTRQGISEYKKADDIVISEKQEKKKT